MLARTHRIMADTNTDPCTGFSALEEEFFRAGDAISAGASTESWSEPDSPPARESVWSRLFKRVSPAVTAIEAGHSTGR